jgi:hypothetical protein
MNSTPQGSTPEKSQIRVHGRRTSRMKTANISAPAFIVGTNSSDTNGECPVRFALWEKKSRNPRPRFKDGRSLVH